MSVLVVGWGVMAQDYEAPPGDAMPACKKSDNGDASPDMGEVWVRKLTDGSMAVAMPNLGAFLLSQVFFSVY